MKEETANQLAGAAAVQTTEKTSAGVELMTFGRFAPRYIKGRDEFTVDIPGWLPISKNKVKPLLLIDYQGDIQSLLELEPFHVYYATNLDIEVKGDVFKAKVNAYSRFTDVTAPSWLKGTLDERKQQFFNQYPHVPLRDAENHLSMLEKNGKGFVDRTDLKVIEVSITSIAWDRDVATLIVEDATIGFFSAHVGRMMLRKAQTGEGSCVKLLGTLESNDYSIFMNVCCLLPLVRMPLIEPSERVLKISEV